MSHRLEIAGRALDALAANPREVIEGRLNGARYQARIAIPDYREKVAHYYAAFGDLNAVCQRTAVEFGFPNFGLVCEFDRPFELALHDDAQNLDAGVRDMVRRFGPLIVRNAQVPADTTGLQQRNIFSDLAFHFDRGANQPAQYSLFIRDPLDPVQAKPRTSSTVFVANIVAHLQQAVERGCRPEDLKQQSRYEIFHRNIADALINDIVLEHPWSEPAGTGELSLLFNRTVFHASYYRGTTEKGYPISVRYLN